VHPPARPVAKLIPKVGDSSVTSKKYIVSSIRFICSTVFSMTTSIAVYSIIGTGLTTIFLIPLSESPHALNSVNVVSAITILLKE